MKRWVLFLSCALLLAPRTAYAQRPRAARPAEEVELRARELYLQGTAFYTQGNYRLAVGAFQQAVKLSRDPAYLYNLAQAQRRIGHARDALKTYEQFLAAAPGALNRPGVERLIAELREQIELPPEQRARRERSVPPRPKSFWVGTTLAIAGLVAVAVGAGLGAYARAVAEDFNSLPQGTPYDERLQQRLELAQSRRSAAYGLLGVGAVLTATGTGLVVWSLARRKVRVGLLRGRSPALASAGASVSF